ncbi:phosphate acyltransferase PlsX [Candidatus Kapabacteria bacterium]|nr:phosphate acyltransferase PlsX [Candidatus Kapabacteria bacterium]
MTSKNKKIRIAIDLMGSDKFPISELDGVARFNQHGIDSNTMFYFIGDEKTITKELPNHNLDGLDYEIVHTSEVVHMDDEATVALRKRNSSIYKGIELQKEGKVDAFISAGNTGATLSISTILLGRIAGASRGTIGTFFPTMEKRPTLILDAGANIDSKPKFLEEFAVMGALYYKEMFQIENPKVALLNIGEEETKGNELALATHKLLKASKLNFIGNVEGRDVLFGKADVIVCDGFTGNILLKFAESFLVFLKQAIRGYADKGLYKKLKVGMFAPTLKDIFKEFDYQEQGGVPLLGVNGVVIIGHGSSTGRAVENMIKRAIEIISVNLNKKIETALSG